MAEDGLFKKDWGSIVKEARNQQELVEMLMQDEQKAEQETEAMTKDNYPALGLFCALDEEQATELVRNLLRARRWPYAAAIVRKHVDTPMRNVKHSGLGKKDKELKDLAKIMVETFAASEKIAAVYLETKRSPEGRVYHELKAQYLPDTVDPDSLGDEVQFHLGYHPYRT